MAGRAEVVAVVDTRLTAPGGAPVVDWGLPVELPYQVLVDLFPAATVTPVVVAGGVVLHAPSALDLGRSTRLASRAQRRVLRGLYPTCAIPGCAVRFDACTVHHVIWWERGGTTDLDNLVPLCSRHHHRVHDDGWHLTLAVDLTLTVTTPAGEVMTTGPPRRGVALREAPGSAGLSTVGRKSRGSANDGPLVTGLSRMVVVRSRRR